MAQATTASWSVSPSVSTVRAADGAVEAGLREEKGTSPVVTPAQADQDLDVIAWSMRLAIIRRYFHQRFWEQETMEAEFASKIEPKLRLESVAEHSWHVADTVMVLAPRFPSIKVAHAVMLAVLHDKMEITTGDISPVGRDGTGTRTHAFNSQARQRKAESERQAIIVYLQRLGPAAAEFQRGLLNELLDEDTAEARFVKAVDKLQALTYVIEKKSGRMTDSHLKFTMQYSSKVLKWPGLSVHLAQLRERLFADIAKYRNVDIESVRRIALGDSDALFDIDLS